MASLSPQDRAQALTHEAAFDFAVGDEKGALTKLNEAVSLAPDFFEAWLAKAEVHFAQRQFDDALQAGEMALKLKPKDIHIHTSLSRIGWSEEIKLRPNIMVRRLESSAGATRLNNPRRSAGRHPIGL
jgi:tetratricopeptide (TPR) repeat protein